MTTHKKLLAEALVLNGQEEKGILLFQELIASGEKVTDEYISALDIAVKNKPQYRDELKRMVSLQLESPNIQEERKRELAYVLIDADFNGEAADIFYDLAKGKSFDVPDVQALLGLWGDHISAGEVKWIEGRAVAYQGDEKAKWLKHLIAAGSPVSVPKLINHEDLQNDALVDTDIEALVYLKHHKEIGDLIDHLVIKEERTARLKQLAKIASDVNEQNTALHTYLKALTFSPNDPGLLKEIGLIYNARGASSCAKAYLMAYFNLCPEGDYLSNYAYGELAKADHLIQKAHRYFELALCQLHKLQKKELSDRMLEAQLLNEIQRPDKAILLYKELLKENPKKLQLYADLANLLIDYERFVEASCLLASAPDLDISKKHDSDTEDEEISVKLARVRLAKERLHYAKALCLSKKLLDDYPEKATIYTSQSGVEYSLNRWRKAVNFLRLAQNVSPDNEGYQKSISEILADHSSFVFAGAEYRVTGLTQLERFGRGAWDYFFKPYTRLSCFYETDYLTLTEFTNQQGITAPFAGAFGRGECNVIHDFTSGTILRGSFYFTQSVLGVGIQEVIPDLSGGWDVLFEYHRPNWDFVQTTIEHGSRDRIRLFRTQKITPHLDFSAGVGCNQYNLQGLTQAATSVTVEALATYRIFASSYINRFLGDRFTASINYSLDAEFAQKVVQKLDPLGVPFYPLPLESRADNTIFFYCSKRFTDYLAIEGFYGNLYNPYGSNLMPAVYECMITFGKHGGLEAHLMYSHGISTAVNTEIVDRYVVDVKYSF